MIINELECTEEESHFIYNEIAKLAIQDQGILEEKYLFEKVKIKYLSSIQRWLDRKPNNRIKLEEKLISHYLGKNDSNIKKVKGVDNLYRIELEETVYSSMIIYSLFDNEIIVRKRVNNFVQRTDIIKNRLLQIEKRYPRVLSTTMCIDYIIENNCSLARFGDGELNLCFGEDIGFQKESPKLQRHLIEVLSYESDKKILITIPEFNSRYNNIINCNGQLSFWENYWIKMYDNVKKFFVHDLYGNTDISRNTVFFENTIEDIKRIWDKRDVIFVISSQGRFEIKPEIFNNLLSYEIIWIPPSNAYDRYEDIIGLCMKQKKDKMFLISAGPTATVLAFDLMKEGYQALDIGHLPNCYDQYLGKIKYPESIPHIRPLPINLI